MGKRLVGFFMVCVLSAGAGIAVDAAGQQQTVTVRAARDGAPAANVRIEFQFVNAGKVPAGTTASTGDLAVAMSLVNGGKPTRVQVVIYDCPADQSLVVFVEVGAVAPENRDCKRTVAGIIWFGRGKLITVDLARALVQAQGQSFLSTTKGRAIAGGGVAVVGLALLTAGGDSNSNGQTPAQQNTTFNPNGNYGVTNTVASDPGEHRFFILMENNTVLTVVITGTNVQITCPPGSKWTLLTGTFTPATGQILAEGRGPAAGFANVLFRFNASIAMSGANRGAMTGSLVIGPNGELNGGPPITYNVAGAKQ